MTQPLSVDFYKVIVSPSKCATRPLDNDEELPYTFPWHSEVYRAKDERPKQREPKKKVKTFRRKQVVTVVFHEMIIFF